ncbi:hypothetical protein MEZE111188_20350 [Mesobacillus zeae]
MEKHKKTILIQEQHFEKGADLIESVLFCLRKGVRKCEITKV